MDKKPAEKEIKQMGFRAMRWERSIANDLLNWYFSNEVSLARMRKFGQAIEQVIQKYTFQFNNANLVATKLPDVLKSCDDLAFDDISEVFAYAALHLLDRYGRITQILEYLMKTGRLPLRKVGISLLEVGAGPAPAGYAVRDFYSLLSRYPRLGDVKVAPLKTLDTIDRGKGWDFFLHYLSECLMSEKSFKFNDGSLSFRRSIDDLKGLDLHKRHHNSVLAYAFLMAREYDDADEYLPDAAIRRLAYQEGVSEPSAYDYIFICNFLSRLDMIDRFETEILHLAYSLTPGGLLIVIGAVGSKYQTIYKKIRQLTAKANLLEISPPDSMQSNTDVERFSLVAQHVRTNVAFFLSRCTAATRAEISGQLPRDITSNTYSFSLPRFQALIFVRQGPASKQRNKHGKKRSKQKE
ncbi:MAG TPA: hypothetical protein VK186_28190 [Candidatus Deferrimicrobium sp.]|nr:hypothetical protein [Candidatus Deferrimicrobium sp.]